MSMHAFPPRGVSAAAPPSLSPLDLFQLALALTVALVFRRLWT